MQEETNKDFGLQVWLAGIHLCKKKACSSLRMATTHVSGARIRSTNLSYMDSGMHVRCRCAEQQYDSFLQVYSALTDKLVFL